MSNSLASYLGAGFVRAGIDRVNLMSLDHRYDESRSRWAIPDSTRFVTQWTRSVPSEQLVDFFLDERERELHTSSIASSSKLWQMKWL